MSPFNSFRSLHLFVLFLPFSCRNVAANTEIINFSPSRKPLVDLPSHTFGNWSDSRLHPFGNERRWTLAPAALHTQPHRVYERTDDDSSFAAGSLGSSADPFRARCARELWVLLDLDDERWASYAAFTLRLSWAGSTPVYFVMSLYAPQELLDVFAPQVSASQTRRPAQSTSLPAQTATTRVRYARIRAAHAGVPVPISDDTIRGPVPASRAGTLRGVDGHTIPPVPFILILEPLYMGVLPASLLPAVGILVLVALTAAWVVPWVTAYLEAFVQQAREEARVARAGVVLTNKLKLKDR